MELFKKLSLHESQQFERIKHVFPSDRKTQQTCLTYYYSYKQQTGYTLADEKVPLALKCAFYMAEKSQTTTNMKGQKIKAIGLSLSELLKAHKLDDIMIMLKDFSKKVQIEDSQVENDLSSVIKEISFLITFYNKFDKTLQKLELKQRVGQSFGYSKTFISFIWLLFALAKNNVLNRSNDLIDNTCMLAQTISFMLTLAWDHIRPMSLYKENKLNDESTPKEVRYCIKQKVLQIFIIKNLETYKDVAERFEAYFNKLIANKLIKCPPKSNDLLSPQLINTNYKKLDHHFQKTQNSYEIDQRIFHKERTTNLTPSKFTPFSRQGYANKGVKTKLGNQLGSDKQNFSSHRILTYEMMDKQQQPQQRNIPVSQMKFPKNVLQTPSTYKAPLICSTPITAGMEMYNYLTQKVRRMQNKFTIDPAIEKVLVRIMSKDKKENQRGGKLQKKKMIACLHQYLVEQYMKGCPSEESDSLYRAFLILSTELVFFVSNIPMTFQDIQQQIEADILDQWRVCDYLIKFDRAMPQTLKVHLIDIQISIISHKIWKDAELVEMLNVCTNGEQSGNESIDRCLRTVLVQIGVQINEMARTLHLDDRMAEGVFDTMKEILISHIDMVQNRHLDQLIICSFYVNCRVAQIDVKFNEIKEKYEEANPYNKSLHEQLIFKVFMHDDDPVDIIKFYNSVFIARLKKFTKVLQEKGNGGSIHHDRKNAVLQSPLKNIIPKDLNRNLKKGLSGKSIMTPQTQLLYAYNESPLLRPDYSHNFKGKSIEQKIIDFQDKQQANPKKYQQIHKNQNQGQAQQISSIFNRKLIKKGNENITPTNQINAGKYSPLLTKGAQSPISISKLPQYSNGQSSQTTINANLNMQNENRNNNIAGNSSMIPIRLNSASQHQVIPLSFNHQISKKFTHSKHPSGSSFASIYERRQ